MQCETDSCLYKCVCVHNYSLLLILYITQTTLKHIHVIEKLFVSVLLMTHSKLQSAFY